MSPAQVELLRDIADALESAARLVKSAEQRLARLRAHAVDSLALPEERRAAALTVLAENIRDYL